MLSIQIHSRGCGACGKIFLLINSTFVVYFLILNSITQYNGVYLFSDIQFQSLK